MDLCQQRVTKHSAKPFSVSFYCSYSDEIPSRFRKHIIREIEEPDHESVHLDNLNRVLANIGRQDAFLSNAEMEELLQEAGCDTRQRYMPVEKMIQLM